MQTHNGGYSPGALPAGDSHDAFFNNWTTQMAISEASRRLSRGFGGQRSGSAMRVTKPSSANNSPRGSMAPRGNGMTVNSSQLSRRQQDRQTQMNIETMRPARPLSWHPSTYMYGTPGYLNQQQACYPMSTPNMYTDNQDMESAYPHLSPLTTSYSTNVSPCSSFSPLPIGTEGCGAPQYTSPSSWETRGDAPYYPQTQLNHLFSEAPALSHVPSLGTPANGNLDWNSYITNGAGNTTPPTPEAFMPQQVHSAVSEPIVPYQPLEPEEDEGEILVGMGLYDTPEKSNDDPQLNHYRSTVSSLLGSTYRPMEAMGKGLTLEQAWEPPKSDDEEEDAEDDD